MRQFILCSMLLLGSAPAQAADIYCEHDRRECSDRPRPGAQLLRTASVPRPASGPAPAASSSPAASGKTHADPVQEQRKDDASRSAMQKDLAARRGVQCKEAQQKYQESIDARRIYRTNKSGEREYLSDTESDAARLNARKAMDELCGKS